jgi:hypothetical protein
MQTIQPDNTDRTPLPSAPRRISAITIRFFGLLFLAVVVLALLWSR